VADCLEVVQSDVVLLFESFEDIDHRILEVGIQLFLDLVGSIVELVRVFHHLAEVFLFELTLKLFKCFDQLHEAILQIVIDRHVTHPSLLKAATGCGLDNLLRNLWQVHKKAPEDREFDLPGRAWYRAEPGQYLENLPDLLLHFRLLQHFDGVCGVVSDLLHTAFAADTNKGVGNDDVLRLAHASKIFTADDALGGGVLLALIGDDQLIEFLQGRSRIFHQLAGTTATANANEAVVDNHVFALVSQRLITEEALVSGVARFLLGNNFLVDLGEVLGGVFLEGGEAGLAAKLHLTTFVDMDKWCTHGAQGFTGDSAGTDGVGFRSGGDLLEFGLVFVERNVRE